jgi:hypothetical protein
MNVSGQLHAATAYPPTPRGKAPGSHCPRRSVGPRAGLDAVQESELSSRIGRPARSIVTIPTELFRILYPYPEPNKTQHSMSVRSILILSSLDSPTDLPPSGFTTKTLCALLIYRMLLLGENPSCAVSRNTLRLHNKAQPVNAVWGNSPCLL